MYLNANNIQCIFLNNFSLFKLFDGIFWDRCKIGTMFRIFVASCKISFLLSLSLSLIILRLIEEEKKKGKLSDNCFLSDIKANYIRSVDRSGRNSVTQL